MDRYRTFAMELKAQYPELYDDYVDTTESRVFKLVKSAI